MKPTPKPDGIMQQIDARQLSLRRIAAELEVNPGHLRRVLMGERRGSAALLQAAADLVDRLISRPGRRQEDVHRLVDAAVHVFFIKRGSFESAICLGIPPRRPPEELEIKGVSRRKPSTAPACKRSRPPAGRQTA